MAHPQPDPQRFDGWRVVLACAAAQAFGVGMVSIYGFVATPVIAEFGASDAQMGFAMSITILSMSAVAPLLGPLLDRGPIRRIMLCGVAIMVTAVWALAQGTQLWHLGLGLAVCSVGFALYGPMPVQVLLVNWFVARRGSAIAVAGIGFSVAGLALPLGAAWLVASLGWRTAVGTIATVAALIVAPLIAAFVVNRPEERGQRPDGPAAVGASEGDARASVVDHSAGEIARDPNFWLIGIGTGIAHSVPVTTIFLVRHMQSFGVEPERAALVFVVMGVFGILGKLASGNLADRMDERWVTIGVLAIYLAGWLAMATGSSLTVMLVAAVPMGFGAGGLVPMPPLLNGACFGRAVVGKVMGMQAALGLPFLIAAAPMVGYVRDRTGNFVSPFLGLAVALVVASAVLFFVRLPKRSAQPARSPQLSE
jgi:OFA family oxalate/formate antiporter-like MFS transporter